MVKSQSRTVITPLLIVSLLTASATTVMTSTGCGFHLRGSSALYGDPLSSEQMALRLSYPAKEQPWAMQLIKSLERANITVYDDTVVSRIKNRVDSNVNIDVAVDTVSDIDSDTVSNVESNMDSVVDNSELQANMVLKIVQSNRSRRIASYTSRAKAAEYTLTERLTYQLLALDGSPLTREITLSSDRVYEFNVNNISGKDQEAEIISRELQQDIIYQLSRHLQKINQDLQPPQPATPDHAPLPESDQRSS